MVQKLNGRLIFTYGSSPKQLIKHKLKLSLLGMLVGIFLLPNLAYLSSITPEEIIALTNEERQAAGLNSLTANQLLTRAAILKGRAILETQTFKHNIGDRKFSAWIRDTGYDYSYVGENLAIDFSTSQNIVTAWNNSPMHKKNLLSPYYKEIGVSAIEGKFQGQDTTIVVQIFGSPAVASVKPLTPGYEINLINAKINFPLTDITNPLIEGRQNLLTEPLLIQTLLPAYENKLIIQFENNLNLSTYKYIVRPEAYASSNNFFIIFISLTLIYLIIALYFYYFFEIKQLVSIKTKLTPYVSNFNRAANVRFNRPANQAFNKI